MPMFTLAISCLTTSNLPWFMDLTFQVPMQYYSLQHQILLLSAVTSTTGYCFCFGSIPSFFLELFLHWSPVLYWSPTDLGSPLSASYHFAFFPMEKKCKKAKWLSEEDLQIAVKRRKAKSKEEKERYKHLNAEFQRVARRDKKAFLRDQQRKRGKQQNGKD